MRAYLEGDLRPQQVRQVLRRARNKTVRVLFSLISYGECLYVTESAQGSRHSQRAAGIIDQLAVRVIPLDRSMLFAATHINATYPVSYADAFTIAVAKGAGAQVMTGDCEFKSVESEVSVLWLPKMQN